jgi:hypothetical protein
LILLHDLNLIFFPSFLHRPHAYLLMNLIGMYNK